MSGIKNMTKKEKLDKIKELCYEHTHTRNASVMVEGSGFSGLINFKDLDVSLGDILFYITNNPDEERLLDIILEMIE